MQTPKEKSKVVVFNEASRTLIPKPNKEKNKKERMQVSICHEDRFKNPKQILRK